jgi:hypothetical protein
LENINLKNACIREIIFLVTSYKIFHLKIPLYSKVMRAKKRATILLKSNHVGSFDCDHTHPSVI